MTAPNNWQEKWFKDSTRLNSPDNILSVKITDKDYAVMCRYSEFQRLKEFNIKSPLPLPTTLYLLMDAPLGECGMPKTDFVALTPYGSFKIFVKEIQFNGDMSPNECTECAWSVNPCNEHL